MKEKRDKLIKLIAGTRSPVLIWKNIYDNILFSSIVDDLIEALEVTEEEIKAAEKRIWDKKR